MKTALIIGGGRGIGKATAEQLRALGWEVLAPTREELDATQPSPWALPDGELDALIFCAGEWYSAPLYLQSPSDWKRQYQYVTGAWLAILATLNQLERASGSVVVVASTRGLIGGMETAPYACAKAAQIALVQGLAREAAGTVRFNCVCPGLTDTDLGQQVIATGGCKAGAVPQPASAVAAEIVRLIESEENGRVMRVVDGLASEAVWTW